MEKTRKRKVKKLKMFVWENCLTDYTSGMICVLAYDLPQALKLIKEKCDYCQSSFDAEKYVIVKKPEAFLVWGGG